MKKTSKKPAPKPTRPIHPDEYIVFDDHGPRLTFEMIQQHHTDAEVKNFSDFMYGQTMSVSKNGVGLIYPWDYERWVRQGMKDHQMAHDWD